ncbi:MAG: UDP-N-acetylmuramate dehydrogenase [Oscillospiraceae bacterium]|nr:UDP-N-acetylmuramate dehydrogenase [Oscillospiraceae bacterium]
MQEILAQLTQAGIPFLEHEPLARHTSFRIGGPVRALVLPQSEAELVQATELLRHAGEVPLIIGNGSNLLAVDTPIDRIAMKTYDGVSALKRLEGDTIYAASGTLLARVAVFAREQGLVGLEFAHGIPGTLGGAVYMNAGAYGGEMGQVVTCVHYLDTQQERQTAQGAELDFSYRHSPFCDNPDVLILGAELTLTPGDPAEIQAKMDELAAKRRTSQPLEFPSGGSTFKRPKTGYAAALIDEAGLKGYAIGGAQVSEKHAGFVINRGGATCDDVLRLMAHIQERVLQRTGVELEAEVKLVW